MTKTMDSRLFFKHLREAPPASVYLFRGDETALMDKAWEALVHAVASLEEKPVKGEQMDARDVTAHEVVGRVRTVPMFAPRRVLRVRDVDQWPKEQRELLERYAADPNPRAHLVLTVGSKKSWKALEKAVEGRGLIVDFTPIPERQLPAWVQEKAAGYGKTMKPAVAAQLVDAVGPDLYALEREIEKLCLYVGDAPRITAEDVDAACSRVRSEHIFKLMDHVAERRPEAAFEALRQVLLKGDSPLALMALLARHVRLMWQIKDGLARGETVAAMGRKLHLPAFVVEKTARHAPRFSAEALEHLHGTLTAVDLALKTTALSPDRALEAVIYQMCAVRAQKEADPVKGPPRTIPVG
ncbi:MAG: DNA polymerase III subunit delta [Desulfosoma sp.]